jgi:hypothetical protein
MDFCPDGDESSSCCNTNDFFHGVYHTQRHGSGHYEV